MWPAVVAPSACGLGWRPTGSDLAVKSTVDTDRLARRLFAGRISDPYTRRKRHAPQLPIAGLRLLAGAIEHGTPAGIHYNRGRGEDGITVVEVVTLAGSALVSGAELTFEPARIDAVFSPASP
jgi:hypothetical protein